MSIRSRVLAALSKIAPRVRDESEFKSVAVAKPQPLKQGPYAWSLEVIRRAIGDQIRGHFDLPVRLAEAMRTDDALYNAYHNRIAPAKALNTRLVAAEGARGEVIARKAAASVFIARSTLAGIHGTFVNHGIAVGYIERDTNDDGNVTTFRLEEWPLEYVRWINGTDQRLTTSTSEGQIVTINHGDGFWVVFRKFKSKPWTQEACLLPGAMCWAAHANGIADWAGASTSHGKAKLFGELPSGVSLRNAADGSTPAEVTAFLQMLTDVMSGDAIAGVRPSGSKTEVVANASTAWQVFDTLAQNREKAAARIYLGTDAILGSVGGAPGIDISALFGITTTILQGDIDAIEQALNTGVYQPWTAINCGDSRYSPSFRYQLPDPDADQKAEQREHRYKGLLDILERLSKDGFVVDQIKIDSLAAELGVENPPVLAPIADKAVPLPLAPTDIAKVVRVSEARRSQGLPAMGDDRDALTITELDQQAQIKVAEIKAAASAAPAPGATPPPPAP